MFLPFLLFFSTLCAIAKASDPECPSMLYPLDRRVNTTSFTIVQYNVEWLFVDYYSEANCPGANCSWKNTSEATTHVEYVSKIINDINPDIINLCEVEGCDELNMLIKNLNTDGGAYMPYLKKGTDSATGQNVGMITRIDPTGDLDRTDERYDYPIPGSKCNYVGAPGSSGVSKNYISEFVLYGKNVVFIGAHLLAYPTDTTRCAEREAQAQVLQNVIFEYYNKGYEVIMMGDFNDFDGEVIDANNNIPISHTLDILKGNFGNHIGKYQLYSVAERIPKASRFSDWWDSNNNCVSTPNEFSMIDHILVSDFLQKKIKRAYFYQAYAEFCDTYNSDHYPLVVEMEGNIYI